VSIVLVWFVNRSGVAGNVDGIGKRWHVERLGVVGFVVWPEMARYVRWPEPVWAEPVCQKGLGWPDQKCQDGSIWPGPVCQAGSG